MATDYVEAPKKRLRLIYTDLSKRKRRHRLVPFLLINKPPIPVKANAQREKGKGEEGNGKN